ncbi:MAG TPA: DUF559 domain-containing protein [Gammaproteobacteria bacterium]|nr:DUF559 domain-containing protein [Gammaproteobacteria bacterium]
MKQLARQLRSNQTEAERKLWRKLRSRNIHGHKFRRQETIGSFIVDFVCFDKKLIIELDGGQHVEQSGADQTRDGPAREAWLSRHQVLESSGFE